MNTPTVALEQIEVGQGRSPHMHEESAKWSTDIVTVTVPGKLENKVYHVSSKTAALHKQRLARILTQTTIWEMTSFSEVVWDITQWYRLRTLAALNENSGAITFIPVDGPDVPALYHAEQKGIDTIQFYPDTLVWNRIPASEAMDKFRS